MDSLLAAFDYMVIEPCPGRPLTIPIFPRGHKLTESDKLAGQHLILYSPNQPVSNNLEYTGMIEPLDIDLRLQNLLIDYGKRIINLCVTAHENCPTEACRFCNRDLPQTRAEVRLGEKYSSHGDGKGWSSWNLAICLLDMIEYIRNQRLHTPTLHAAWVSSTQGLGEMYGLLAERQLISNPPNLKRWTWEAVIVSHFNMFSHASEPLTIEKIKRAKFVTEHPAVVASMALLAVRCGRYDDVFIYAGGDYLS